MKSTGPAIKGYLPLRITLPSIGHTKQHAFTSFLFIKEHVPRPAVPDGGAAATLFVANAPARLCVPTDVFLRALFEPYGAVRRVTVAGNPRRVTASAPSPDDGAVVEAFRATGHEGAAPSAERGQRGDGRFAHIIFESSKELKRALKGIRKEAARATGESFVLRAEAERVEQLVADTSRGPPADDDASDKEHDASEDGGEGRATEEALIGIHAVVAQARRRAGRHLPRAKLMQLCNEAVTSFEAQEADLARRAKAAAAQPDEDGFVTVDRGAGLVFGAVDGLEERGDHRRRAGKRTRKRKNGASGADEQSNFYRFQRKEQRRDEVRDLKRRFEEDLAQVKKRREERAYRPF